MEMTPVILKQELIKIVCGDGTHILGEVFKDSWCSSHPWRVQLPKGAFPCRTKREALRISDLIFARLGEVK